MRGSNRHRAHFQVLLDQLGEEHELQVAALLGKIVSLELKLSEQADGCEMKMAFSKKERSGEKLTRGMRSHSDFGEDTPTSSTYSSEGVAPTVKVTFSSDEAILSERKPVGDTLLYDPPPRLLASHPALQDGPVAERGDPFLCKKASMGKACSETSSDGVGTFKMHAAWHSQPEYHGDSGLYSIGRMDVAEEESVKMRKSSSTKNLEKLFFSSPDSQRCAILNRLVLHPTSGPSMLWSMLSVLAIAYDVATIPLLLLGSNENLPMKIISMSTSVYWTVDVVASFFKAYYEHGLLVTDVRPIARQYFRGCFVLDMMMVSLDWGTVLLQAGNGVGGLSRASRALRMLRLTQTLRLARVSKAACFLNRIQELFGGGLLQMQLNILGVSLGILTLSHWLACIWYGIGTIGISDVSWITVYGAKPDEMSFGARYIICLHWALAQFGVGSSPLLPVTPVEYAYCTVVLMVALLMASSLVSSMTNAVAQLKDLKTDEIEQFTLLRRFCRDHRVPAQLYSRLYKYAEHRYKSSSMSLSMNDVKLINLMSRPLLEELHQHLWTPYLAEHPVLHRFSAGRYGGALRSLCYEATETRWMASKDLVHTHGTLASSMYFIVAGELQYMEEYKGIDEEYRPRRNELLEAPSYLLEMPLWVSWITLGTIEAASVAQILMLKGEEFLRVCEKQPEAFYIARGYAVRYIMWLNNARPGELSDTMRMPEDYRTLRSL